MDLVPFLRATLGRFEVFVGVLLSNFIRPIRLCANALNIISFVAHNVQEIIQQVAVFRRHNDPN